MRARESGARRMWDGLWMLYCKSFNADGIYLMLAGTTFAHSFGMPRVGLLASRAMIGGAAYGRDRPSDGG